MSARDLCIPLPDGRWIMLTEDAFAAALAAGAALKPPHKPLSPSTGGDPLVDAAQLAEVLQVPVSWVAEQARKETLPVIRLGKYVRFSPSAVLLHLQDTRIVCASGAFKSLKTVRKNGALRIRNSDFQRPGTGAKEVR